MAFVAQPVSGCVWVIPVASPELEDGTALWLQIFWGPTNRLIQGVGFPSFGIKCPGGHRESLKQKEGMAHRVGLQFSSVVTGRWPRLSAHLICPVHLPCVSLV